MPKKYSFSLESVLNYRNIIENQKERAFSAALYDYQLEQKRLTELKESYVSAMKKFQELEQVTFSSGNYFEFLNYIKRIEKKIANQKIRIATAHEILENKRNELIKATRDRKVLERLKDIGKENYLKEMDRLEQIFLDEIAVIRHSKL